MTAFLLDVPGVGEVTKVPAPTDVRLTLRRAEPWLNIRVGSPTDVRIWADVLGVAAPLTVCHATSEFGTRRRDAYVCVTVQGVRVVVGCTQYALIGEELPAWPTGLAMVERVQAVAE